MSIKANIPFRWKRIRMKIRLLKIKKWMLWLLPIAGLWYGWMRVEPYIYIESLDMSHHDHGGREAIEADEARLVSIGSRAIDPILDKLSGGGSFDWESASILGVLHKIGEPAHQRLLSRIDNDNNDTHRLGLINALQISFGDYSRVNFWLDDIRLGQLHNSYELHTSLSYHFSEVPTVTDDQGIWKDDFVAWYEKMHASTGRVPAYDFYRTDDYQSK